MGPISLHLYFLSVDSGLDIKRGSLVYWGKALKKIPNLESPK